MLRPLLFSGLRADPEWLHQQTLQTLGWLDETTTIRSVVCDRLTASYKYVDDRLSQSLWGLDFANPLGLAAGFDKNGVGAGLWSHFGFGFAELGTVTLHGQPGNPPPRLFRLMEDAAVLNRMGFNNDGAVMLQQRLQHLAQRLPQREIPIGINLGKSKVTPLEEAAEDYRGSFKLLKDLGDYFVVNVSSPNTPGLRSLQSIDQLEPIFTALNEENTDGKPILVKIAPDLADEDIRAVVDLSMRSQMSGIIATNTTIRRDGLKTQVIAKTGKSVADEAGGISGKPVRDRSTEVIRLIYQQTQGELLIVGVGGIFTAQDAWEKIIAGASLVQVYTGWIYEGPGMAKRVMQGLVERLDQAGMQQISEAVGTAVK
ncbi:quinone-dependent dihydroorotate dehydrogenase [filamentous cyanobacterium LEGE 11480]|uniref:Dihydroorotate dehydrogenase (quinone) n=1 Tax=Romeriopsis navalis LEGE 11480 TaxID=2777977 RepID=A0A928Z406_9CYAN|nr:quinone-dependent dihydroorotate dehydrogenase [Romeriopsis navalis LEGE 11480]